MNLIDAAVRHVQTVERADTDRKLVEKLRALLALQRRYELIRDVVGDIGMTGPSVTKFLASPPVMGATFAEPLENDLLDGVLGGPDYTLVANVFCGLQTAITGLEAGDTDAEVPDSNNYARVAITNDATNWPAAAAGAKANGTAITFGTASGSWGTVSHAFLALAVTHDGDDVIMWGALTTPKAIDTDDTAEFAIGDFDVTLD